MIQTRIEVVKIPEIYSNSHREWIEHNVIVLVHSNQFVYKNKSVDFYKWIKLR